jgi:hypothetical protein
LNWIQWKKIVSVRPNDWLQHHQKLKTMIVINPEDKRVYCEDCKYHDYTDHCNKPEFQRTSGSYPCITRKKATYSPYCADVNDRGECSGFSPKWIIRLINFLLPNINECL